MTRSTVSSCWKLLALSAYAVVIQLHTLVWFPFSSEAYEQALTLLWTISSLMLVTACVCLKQHIVLLCKDCKQHAKDGMWPGLAQQGCKHLKVDTLHEAALVTTCACLIEYSMLFGEMASSMSSRMRCLLVLRLWL